jgi:hypothetical protein
MKDQIRMLVMRTLFIAGIGGRAAKRVEIPSAA